MPSHLAEEFGTAAWFDQISMPLPSELPDPPRFIVEHRAVNTNNRMVVHQQLFSQGRLASWVPGRATQETNLILIRPTDCDFADLLGQIPAGDVLAQTVVMMRGHQPTCALGIANVRRPGLQEVTSGTVDVRLEVSGTPFGDAESAIRLNPDGSQHFVVPSEADSDITLALRWDALTEWIHSDTGLGHLIGSGDIGFDGPMFKLSYIEGHLCWPRHPHDDQQRHRFKAAMDTYAQLRHSPGFLELMDEIDEATSR